MRERLAEFENIQMTEPPRRAIFRLKSWLPAVVRGEVPIFVAGNELPQGVGATQVAEWRTLCLGAAEWLVVSEALDAQEIRRLIQPDCTRQSLALTELTDALATLQITGASARELLSKGCGLDLHPRTFPVGLAVRTRFASLPVTLDCLDDSPRFELSVSRSYFAFLRAWLKDAAAEFGELSDAAI